MSKKDNGGAFHSGRRYFNGVEINVDGISRRDWLAGLAMQGMLANSEQHLRYADLVVYSYKIADAMIEEGNK